MVCFGTDEIFRFMFFSTLLLPLLGPWSKQGFFGQSILSPSQQILVSPSILSWQKGRCTEWENPAALEVLSLLLEQHRLF